jgi:hypothetical protein
LQVRGELLDGFIEVPRRMTLKIGRGSFCVSY